MQPGTPSAAGTGGEGDEHGSRRGSASSRSARPVMFDTAPSGAPARTLLPTPLLPSLQSLRSCPRPPPRAVVPSYYSPTAAYLEGLTSWEFNIFRARDALASELGHSDPTSPAANVPTFVVTVAAVVDRLNLPEELALPTEARSRVRVSVRLCM